MHPECHGNPGGNETDDSRRRGGLPAHAGFGRMSGRTDGSHGAGTATFDGLIVWARLVIDVRLEDMRHVAAHAIRDKAAVKRCIGVVQRFQRKSTWRWTLCSNREYIEWRLQSRP